jgi:hypothetical protein
MGVSAIDQARGQMPSNIDRYKKDLDALIAKGERVNVVMQHDCNPKQVETAIREQLGEEKVKEFIASLEPFSIIYQSWYSEAKALIAQLLPGRLSDFVRHYEKPKPRKDITYESYRIEDYLQRLTLRRPYSDETIVGPTAAIPHFEQQLAILKSIGARFESSLYDIRQLVQSDLFDSELDAAKELAKHKFIRAAGAIAGVVLERHLAQVCENHSVKVTKKNPGIADFNDALKAANVLDTPQWRFVQHLGDIRNLCDHNKSSEPTPEQVDDLVQGVAKTIKTLF